MRDFWRSADGTLPDFATRVTGSSDLYGHGRRPSASINLVTVHDGFTLADLVSYNQKHNEANGESNRDGSDDNRSWNCGVEGPTDDPTVLALRLQQRRDFLATLLLSEGVPLLLGGDELGRTQQGNNNAYCQDNEISWVDWSLAGRAEDLSEFVAELCRRRLSAPLIQQNRFLRAGEIAWLRPDGQPMTTDDWNAPFAHAVTVADPAGNVVLTINAWWQPLTVQLPALTGDAPLTVSLDTAGVHAPGSAVQVQVAVTARSLVLLERTAA